jgi:hypothetical protein
MFEKLDAEKAKTARHAIIVKAHKAKVGDYAQVLWIQRR